MKKNYKLLALTLLVVCLLVACVTLCACDDNEDTTPPAVEPTYFEITTNTQQGGSCQLSAPADGKGYADGESVTVTVVEDEGFALTTMTVNGQAVETIDKKYTFTVSQDTEISVAFEFCAVIDSDMEKGIVILVAPQNRHSFVRGESAVFTITATANFSVDQVFVDGAEVTPQNGAYIFTVGDNKPFIEVKYIGNAMPNDIYQTLCGSVKFSGDYHYEVTNGESTHNTIETIFNAKAVSQIEKDFETGEVLYDSYIKKSSTNPRAIAFVARTIDNKVVEYTDESHYFSDYSNQFDLMSANDFEYISEGVYSLYDADKAKRAASAITGWNESIAKFYVYVENGKAVRAEIVTEAIEVPSQDSNDTYTSTYTFEISEHGTATIPPVLPYERDEHHDALEQALQNAQLASWYTVNHFGHEVGYVPPEDGDPGDGYGDLDYYVYITEDMVYDSFLTEEHGFKVIGDYVYPFTYERDVDKVVITDPIDVASIQELQAVFNGFSVELFEYVGDGRYVLQDNTLAGEIATLIGEGNEKRYYGFALNLSITIKDGVLYTIEFTYQTYNLLEEVRLTYDFVTPINVNLDFENVTKESILDPFKGTYADSEGNYVVVDDYGFTINGIEAEVYAYNKDKSMFTLLWNEQKLYVQKLSTKQIVIANEDSTMIIIVTMLGDQIVNIPAEMKGVWYISTSDEQGPVEYKFEIQTHVVKLDGKTINVLSYTDSEGLVCEDENGTYSMFVKQFDDGVGLVLYHVFPDGKNLYCVLELTNEKIGIEIPLEFVGTYMTVDLNPEKVEITTSTITVNGIEFIPTSYDADTKTFTGTLGDDTNYTLGFGYNADWIIAGGKSYERTEVILPTYIGTWQSSVDPNDPNDKQYIVIIDETSICINGEYVKFVKDEYGYTFELPGSAFTTHIIYFSSSTNGKVTLWMYDNNVLLKSLTKVGEDGDTKWPATYIGEWSGTDSNGTAYTITITEDSLSIKVGDAEAVVCEDAKFDLDAILFTFDGNEYVFSLVEGKAYVYCQKLDWNAILTKATE